MMLASNSCNEDIWWGSLAASSLLYLIGAATSLVALVIHSMLLHKLACMHRVGTLFRNVRKMCQQCTSVDHYLGRFMIVFHICCNVAYCSLVIYQLYQPVIRCFDESLQVDIKIELVVSISLSFYFLIRFLAASNIAKFWFNPYIVIDIFTIPTVFVACALYKDWVGLRPLRFIWLIQISDILKFSRRIRSSFIADVTTILLRFICIWITASGIICVLESSGDPWNNFINAQNVTFREYTYYIMVTMSTVGYGDYFPKTAWGQTFITFFIVAGLAIFAVSLPVLVDPLIQYYRIASYLDFDNTRIHKHVLVCGHINAPSVQEFLKEFLHPDHGDKATHVVFIDPVYPSPELKTTISKYSRSHFLLGSVLNSDTLRKGKIKDANACIILANRHCSDPVTEDSTSMFYLVSIKNTCSSVPVIIQVLSPGSKDYIENIEGWNSEKDVVLCLNELRLGILALNASCPGASTLISNLFYACGDLKTSGGWQSLYLEGAGNEVYEVPFSHSFNGLTFMEAVKMCYDELNLMLIGIKGSTCHLNPSATDIHIHNGTLGYFIGKNFESVQIVSRHCFKCNRLAGNRRRVCKCEIDNVIENSNVPLHYIDTNKSTPAHEVHIEQFYTSQPQHLAQCVLSNQQVLHNHIVLCVFALDYSAKLGLNSFVAPLRSKSIPALQLKPIVIVSCASFIEKEWFNLSCFPMVYVVIGSPLNWNCLSNASVQNCSSCFLLTALTNNYILDNALHDKEAILCCLSLQKKLKNTSVFVITDLVHDSNVQFLDFSDEDTEGELYQAEPFACGNAFAASVFNSVTTTAYHRPGTIKLIANLISSEQGNQLFSTRILPNYGSHYQFSELYSHLLEQKLICIALYRQYPQNPIKGYVITNPPKDLVLDPNDTAIVITPSMP